MADPLSDDQLAELIEAVRADTKVIRSALEHSDLTTDQHDLFDLFTLGLLDACDRAEGDN